ncbi:AraC family transcriptional regulator [Thalassospiraceae bacterium LMO-JJ14]|nr:AraC family transcriptional regulator [Thalassospiraceae bacterium LMO-JJ14]
MRFDRLSALIQRFTLHVELCAPGEGNMRVLGSESDGTPTRVVFSPTGRAVAQPVGEKVLLEAVVDWGGADNPLLAALPSTLALPVEDADTVPLLQVFLAEAAAARCGSGSALSRLAEVLVIRILRAQIERGTTEPGLIAGLANPKISRAIVAMHDNPGNAWRNDDLAAIAGMSLSRFCDVFRELVDRTPQSYLRHWRMTLARQDLDRGVQVQAVARRYGYTSPEALTRAFQRQYGISPSDLKRAARVH